MNDVIREFLLETHENLGQLDADLVALEKNPTEKATLARVFRTLHTVKGSAGFLGLIKLQAVAHSAENLLSRLRAGEMTLNPPIATALLQTVDAIRQVLASLEADGGEGPGDYTSLVQELDRLREGAGGAAHQVAPSVPPQEQLATTSELPSHRAASPPLTSQVIVVPERDATASEPSEPRASPVSDSSIRVDVGLLDKLMTLVGELVLARNQIVQYSTSQEDGAFVATVQRLNLLTTELQANVMKTRMQPIGNVWTKFPRVVRDLAIACSKQVQIEMEGQETELDKTIIEAIRDPLTHIVRNAVDHGMELPAARVGLGKPAEGRLTLHAFHEGGKVIIEMTDDGAGIDPARVRDKAIKSKIITSEDASRMSDRELVNLVFVPGFSTADKVTHFSGRGVGMDVVRTNIERIGGTVDLESRIGLGTTVRMKIPLTLAIIPALTVTSGGERYAIPQVSLLELVRLDGEQIQQRIESIHGAPVYRLRGNLLPLVYLNRELQIGSGQASNGEINVVVLQADDRQFGLVVDAIHDTEEIVVKPLQKQLKGISAFAGATIMGDGGVALILDVLGLAQRAHVLTGARARAHAENGDRTGVATTNLKQSLLLFSTRDGGRMAIPLAVVARLEEFPRSALERVGNRYVVQYRGEILPLVDIARAMRSDEPRVQRGSGNGGTKPRRNGSSENVPVIVYADAARPVGLVVGGILDIVEEEVVATTRSGRPGVLHTAVVQGRVTEFLDAAWLVRRTVPEIAGDLAAV
jgi:two-component system chemotaxis sensor kinase CheA